MCELRSWSACGVVVLWFGCLAAVCDAAPGADDGWVIVTPKATDAILANPGMGWQTFHQTRKQDKNLPSWIPIQLLGLDLVWDANRTRVRD